LKKQLKAVKEEKRLAREKIQLERSGGAKKPVVETDNSEEEDDLLVPKKSASQSLELNSVAIPEPIVSGPKKKKAKSLKIGFDGESAASRKAGAKRVAFDDSGKMIDPLEKIMAMNRESSDEESDEEGDGDLAADVTARVAAARQVIDSGRKEDNLRERQRIKEKHLKLKQKLREERDQMQQGGTGVATLANFIPEEESEDGSDSDEDSDADEESESEDEKTESQRNQKKRKASHQSSDEESDSSSSSSGEEESDDEDLKSREQLALEILAKKK
jgi:hypothetical protein